MSEMILPSPEKRYPSETLTINKKIKNIEFKGYIDGVVQIWECEISKLRELIQ